MQRLQRATIRWGNPVGSVSRRQTMTFGAVTKTRYRYLGNDMLGILCIIANLLDPLLCYALLIDEERNCVDFDNRLMTAAAVLRLLTDVVYAVGIVWSDHNSMDRGVGERTRKYPFPILVADVLVTFVLKPPVVIAWVIPGFKGSCFMKALWVSKFILLIQYLARIYRVHSLLNKVGQSSSILPDTTEVKAVLNLFLYLIAGHVIGGFWYLFSIERKATCWQENLIHWPLNCKYYSDGVGLLKNASCSPNASNDSASFDFGIFGDAFKSGVVYSSHIFWKISYCYWWGLQSISSLGQGLKTSNYIWEIYFAITITIAGMILFAIFIGNLQTYVQARTLRSEQIRLMKRKEEIQDWMEHHSLPDDQKRQIEQYEYIWQGIKGVDVENLLNNLPRDIARNTTRHLCLNRLGICLVPRFQNMDQDALKAICDRLKPVVYGERQIIFREEDELDKMIFIIEGQLQVYSRSNNGEAGNPLGPLRITRDGYYGDRLLDWVTPENPSSSNIPRSTETVWTLTNVEAFVLMANDLRSFTGTFRNSDSNNSSIL